MSLFSVDSLSGCPIAAMERAHKDKAVLKPPTLNPALVLAAGGIPSPATTHALSSASGSSSSDRVLRPMCFVKQLDIPSQYAAPGTSSYATPRTNLAKELEKYSKPQLTECVPTPVSSSPYAIQVAVLPPANPYHRPIAPKLAKADDALAMQQHVAQAQFLGSHSQVESSHHDGASPDEMSMMVDAHPHAHRQHPHPQEHDYPPGLIK